MVLSVVYRLIISLHEAEESGGDVRAEGEITHFIYRELLYNEAIIIKGVYDIIPVPPDLGLHRVTLEGVSA